MTRKFCPLTVQYRAVGPSAPHLAGEDSFELWRSDCTVADKNAWESSADLWKSWRGWAEKAGEVVGTQRGFSSKLEDHGFVPERRSHMSTRGYRGARIICRDYTDNPRYGS